jgi:hypothetical protein
VDADAELHLIRADLERRRRRGRSPGRRERHPEAAPVLVDLAGNSRDFGERAARGSLGTGDLLRQDCDAYTAAAGRVEAVLDGYVVVRQDRLDPDVLVLRQLGGELEVHDIARVVLDDVEDTGAAVDGFRCGEHLVGHR